MVSTDLFCRAINGESSSADDCDDTTPMVNPGVAETAGNKVDENCDGVIDCYVDHDGDSYGTDVGTIISSLDAQCLAVDGESITMDDCDDVAAGVNLGATEVCDGIDNDCDTLVDDLDPSLVGGPCVVDTDGDGLLDVDEVSWGTDPNNPDSDTLNDDEVVVLGSAPNSGNTDGDGDLLSDGVDAVGCSDPLNPDTDGGGVGDGTEVANGTDPTLATDDGVP